MEFHAGTGIFITHEIIVNGMLAFSKGEQAVVEQIAENHQRPDNKYVVLSRRLEQRFQLSDNDIMLIPRQHAASPPVARPVDRPQQVVPSPSGYTPQPAVAYGAAVPPGGYAGVPMKNTFPVWGIVLIIVVLLLAIGIPVAIFMKSSAKSAENRRTCQANLRTIDGAINVYNGQYDAYPPNGQVGDILVPWLIKTTPTCPTTGETYMMVDGTSSVPPVVTCPTNEPGHTI